MAENIEVFCLKRIIEALYQEQKSMWNSEKKDNFASKEAIKLKADLLRQNWREIDDFDLKSILEPEKVDFFQRNKVAMFLPPFEKETAAFVPVMSLQYTYDKGDPSKNTFAIRVMMMTSASADQPIPCQSIGFRIESPHDGELGRHKFYHAQFIHSFDYGPWKAGLAETIEWLPLQQPSFPLWATNPTEAVLCLILTLYGKVYYNKFYGTYATRFSKAIQQEFKNLHARLMQ